MSGPPSGGGCTRCATTSVGGRGSGRKLPAAQQAAAAYQVSPATIRRWHRLYRAGRFGGPRFAHARTPQRRPVRQWGGAVPGGRAAAPLRLESKKRLAHELAQRGIAQLSHTTVGRIFARYYLPTRTYHTLAIRDGIPKRRYAAAQPNQQWHIDFAETKLADGARVVVVVLIDDYSRLRLLSGRPDMSSESGAPSGVAGLRPPARAASVTTAGPSRRFTWGA